MNTHFQFLHKSLQLYRYPKRFAHPSWQAWDSADELMLQHVFENTEQSESDQNHEAHLLIFNDDFGALTCSLSPAKITHVSDSFVAQKACQQNLALNQLMTAPVTFLDSLQTLPQKPDWVLIKLPKTQALLEHQLWQIRHVIGDDTKVVAAAKAKAIQKSTLALFEKYLGPTRTSLAKKKSRLVFCEQTFPLPKAAEPKPCVWHSDDKQLSIFNHANVFARQQMDIGGRVLIANLPDCQQKRVLDLGCGNGVVGLSVLQQTADCQVTFVDESYMAVASAKQNVEHNFPHLLENCRFVVSNCLEQVEAADRFDLVLCNPPFHQQNTITDHIAMQMFTDAKQKLIKGGELRIVGNRHLDYPQKLKRLFGGYQVIASDRKFSVLSSVK